MNNLVYLFELDSVRKQESPIHGGVAETQGARALFYEIINNGNCVAVSMNQLTDSLFFSQAISDDFAYPLLLQLFESGALRVSLYGSIRTASQYIQQAMEKCLSENEDSFIFSNLPVKHEEKVLLRVLQDALRFSDLAQLEAMVCDCAEADREKMEYIYRFIEMILKVSTAKLGSIAAKPTPSRSFEFFLFTAIRILENVSFSDPQLNEQIQNALVSLMQTSALITEGRNNRSNWLKAQPGASPLSPMAVELIHLCYNYTVEDSINGVCKHYDDSNFEESFMQDLKKQIQFYYAPSQAGKPKAISRQKWKTAVRFAQYRKKQPLTPNGIYEEATAEGRRVWKLFAVARAAVALVWTLFYAALFFAVELAIDQLEGMFSLSLENAFISTILNILLFSLLGSLLGMLLKKANRGKDTPDIFECVSEIFLRICDCIYVLFGGKQ